jgi:diguanylate cyclase
MNESDKDGASDFEASGQTGGVSQHQDEVAISSEIKITHEKNALSEEEAVVLSHQKSVTQRKDAVELRENVADSREDIAHGREETATLREQVIYAADSGQTTQKDVLKQRENVCDSREDTAHRREETATLREQIIKGTDTEGAADEHLMMVRQANSQLIISAIESQKLAEQVEIAKAKLHHLAHHDALTGLPNRMLLQDRLNQAIELAARQARRFAVLFMDMDRFKQINDSLGHAVGDQLLQSIAHRLGDCVRNSDTLSRQGGDEFVVLLSNIMHAEDAALIAQKILTALAVPYLLDHHELRVSVSIGIGIYPDHGSDAETLLKSADIAMYHAKESGRNHYKFFETESQSALRTEAAGIFAALPAKNRSSK